MFFMGNNTDPLHFLWRRLCLPFWRKCIVPILIAKRIPDVRKHYAEHLNNIRSRVSPEIKVLFLVSHTTKWKCETVFRAMTQSNIFNCTIAISCSEDDLNISVQERELKLLHLRAFFEGCGHPTVLAWDCEHDRPRSLSEFSPNVVFYQHPWYWPAGQTVDEVAHFALTCYIPYFVTVYANPTAHVLTQFHQELFVHFVVNDSLADYYRQSANKGHSLAGTIEGLGHPMIDDLLSAKIDAPGDIVIYAPHWSVVHPNNAEKTNFSTFLTTGEALLAYAQRHIETRWAFRPHPLLRTTLIKFGIWSKEKVDAYWQAWKQIGILSVEGSYSDLFRLSFALITDCDSFLAEYACSRKPIIYLVGPGRSKRNFSPYGNLFKTYYQATNFRQLEPLLATIIEHRQDPLRDQRLKALMASGLDSSGATRRIVDWLKRTLAPSQGA